jgi:trimethylamine--corrinoid protein Co-methyltransferase
VRYKRGTRRLLSETQIAQVHEYTLRLLGEVGCAVQSTEALEVLGQAGCDVSDPGRVRFPRQLVNTALEAAPHRIEVFDRTGRRAMVLEQEATYFGTGSDCAATLDLHSGERRSCMKADVASLARFCDGLPNIDFVMSFGIANDAPPGSNFVHQYEAMLANTAKPALVTGHGSRDMMTMIEMAAVAVGGLEEVAERPPLILYSEPFSPLVHTEMGVSKALRCAEHGVPFIYIGSPMMGASCPVTLEGALVQTVAESLSGLIIFQMKQPGAKFIFGGDTTVFDMKAGIFAYGAPELNVLNAALADMAHFYDLPFFCIAGATDAKTLDAQAGFEYAMGLYTAAMNGCNLIHDCGYLESGLTSSFESVLFADEAIGAVRRMLRPLTFDDETVPFELMARQGPRGYFLGEAHTRRHFKQSTWFPRFFDRRRFEAWYQDGARDVREVLRQEARAHLERSTSAPLSDSAAERISHLVRNHRPDVE